ncbi:MAG: hypothetical protein O1I36_18110 [Cylindrospermopsis raciborskii PAMP2011]|nr:hypothetical protein [Cylindrospermopsis raciborskii PAMP2011]
MIGRFNAVTTISAGTAQNSITNRLLEREERERERERESKRVLGYVKLQLTMRNCGY